jgi:hypothetical protein
MNSKISRLKFLKASNSKFIPALFFCAGLKSMMESLMFSSPDMLLELNSNSNRQKETGVSGPARYGISPDLNPHHVDVVARIPQLLFAAHGKHRGDRLHCTMRGKADLLICVASAAAAPGGELNEKFAIDMTMLLIEVWSDSTGLIHASCLL